MRPLGRFSHKGLRRLNPANFAVYHGRLHQPLIHSLRTFSTAHARYLSGTAGITEDTSNTPTTWSPSETCIYDTVGSDFVIALSPASTPTDLFVYSIRSDSTLGDLKEEIRRSAFPGDSVQVLNSHGSPYATSVKLETLVNADWQVKVEHELFKSFRSSTDSIVEHNELQSSQSTLLSHFTQLIGKLETEEASRVVDESYITAESQTIPMTCHYHGANAERNWKDLTLCLLENEKKICRLSSDKTFCNAVVSSRELYSILDPLNSALEQRRNELEELLSKTENEINSKQEISRQVSRKAQKQLQFASYGLGSFMVGQWIFIFDTVYQTSWDFMEPICYFIGAAYAIVGYSFYMATKKEPDNSKVWTQLIKGRREKVYQKLLKDSTKSFGSLEEEIEDLKNEAESIRLRLRLLDLRVFGSRIENKSG